MIQHTLSKSKQGCWCMCQFNRSKPIRHGPEYSASLRSLANVGRGDAFWLTPLSTSARHSNNMNVATLTDILIFTPYSFASSSKIITSVLCRAAQYKSQLRATTVGWMEFRCVKRDVNAHKTLWVEWSLSAVTGRIMNRQKKDFWLEKEDVSYAVPKPFKNPIITFLLANFSKTT